MIVNFPDDIMIGVCMPDGVDICVGRYDALCLAYDRLHARWLRHAGGEAQCAFEGAVTALLCPGQAVLDAACGTGTVARRMMACVDGALDLTLLDASARMLARCRDIPAPRVRGRIEALPLEPQRFDLVTCAWGMETSAAPDVVLREFFRVTRPGGHICLVFCADRPCQSWIGYGLRQRIIMTGRGRFLDPAHTHGLATELGAKAVRPIHCSGPAAAMIIQV